MSTSLTGRTIGVAHHAVRAQLEHRLAGTGLDFEHWTALNLVGAQGPMTGQELTAFVTDGLKLSPEQARDRIATLHEKGLLTGDQELTATGHRLWTEVTARVRPVTAHLFGGISEDEKAVTARVLATITERANSYDSA